MKGLTYILELEGMSSSQLAEKIAVSVSIIYRWEQGKSKIPKKRIEQFQEIFQIYPIDYFEKELSENDMITLKIKHLANKIKLVENKDDLESIKRHIIYTDELEYNLNLLKQQIVINKIKDNFEQTKSLSINFREGLSVRQNMIEDFTMLCELEEKYLKAIMMCEQGNKKFEETVGILKKDLELFFKTLSTRFNSLDSLTEEDFGYDFNANFSRKLY